MKVLFVCLLFIHCQASIFDDFNDAVQSVENSFENLVGDVKTTIQCTIYAVERVLSFGALGESSDASGCSYEQTQTDDSPKINIDITTRNKEYFSSQIDRSITDVHKTLFDLLHKRGSSQTIDGVKSQFSLGTNRMSEISSLLMHGFDNVSNNIKRKFTGLHSESEPSVDNIWSNVKILKEVQSVETDPQEAKEINDVFDKIIGILQVNGTNDSKDEDKAKTIFKSLESRASINITDAIKNNKFPQTVTAHEVAQQIFIKSNKAYDESKPTKDDNYSKWKTEGKDHNQKILDRVSDDLPDSLKDVGRTILKTQEHSKFNILKSEVKSENSEVPEKTNSFKDVTLRIFKAANVARNDESGFQASRKDDSQISFKHYTAPKVSDKNDRPDYFSSFADLLPQDKASHTSAVERAQKIIQDNSYSEKVMSSIFDNPNVVTVDVFHNPGSLV